jgi:hypothetical protein
VLDAAPVHVFDRADTGKRGDRAAMPVGAQEQLVLCGEQQLAAHRIHGRHRPLAKDHKVVFGQSEPFVFC